MRFLENYGYLYFTMQVSPQNCGKVGGVFQTKVLRLLLFQVPTTYSYTGLEVGFIP